LNFVDRFFSAAPEEKKPVAESSTSKAEFAAPPSKGGTKREDLPVTFADISRAHVAIRKGVVRTQCEKSFFLSELTGSNIYIKPEFRQFTGSFKERGARNALMKLTPDAAKRGVIAASAGNHALALAYHGQVLGIPVTVVMPTVAPLAKVDKCRKFGARIIIEGAHIGEAKKYAETLVESAKLTYINGYDDPPIIAGAGTIGIEVRFANERHGTG
jgi:threonine dehydratase